MVPDSEPRSYWRAKLALGLGVALAASAGLFIGLNPKEPDPTRNDAYEEIDPAYNPGGDACDPSTIGPFPWREGPHDAERCKGEREQHRLAANDLIQQRRAADAAEASAWYAFRQTRIALLGLIFGGLTLVAAAAAAYFAWLAASAAGSAVNAAKLQVDVSERALALDKRPWINITVEPVTDGGVAFYAVEDAFYVYAKTRVENHGRSPAYFTKFEETFSLTDDIARTGRTEAERARFCHDDADSVVFPNEISPRTNSTVKIPVAAGYPELTSDGSMVFKCSVDFGVIYSDTVSVDKYETIRRYIIKIPLSREEWKGRDWVSSFDIREHFTVSAT